MSQMLMSPPPAPAPGPTQGSVPSHRPLGTGAWIALGTSILVGVVYTGVLGTLLAIGVGSAFDSASGSESPSVPAEPFGDSSDDPFGSGDPSDPLYDYPGYQDGDAATILGQPSAEKVRASAEQAVAAVESAVPEEWTSADDEYYEQSQNAYGGRSLLYDYISATEYSVADVSTDADKQAVVDRFAAALAPLGFDEIEIADTPDEWSDVGYEFDGDLSNEEASAALWVVTARSSADLVPAIELGLVDLDADPSGRVADMLDGVGLSPEPQGAFLAGYANGILEDGDRGAFTDRLAKYGGVATT
ncbi:hypothetical protein C5C18_05235 [Rathayibacter tritici]|uniref:hypothetical protein n=1 Tax=Rathayibacter tritici TaxID=33888 RepID=UPI000CE90506|nr:hypothetical protein [Rathayibacter tritici]PPF30774.1 hypothetical protein C5C06_04175 [Rathayibacter tritici]PPF68173.1 hypothetical protein C5C21_05735 [Rathayibacter tritici]PPG07943.1 hypothetical protein C5C18_05235 [Rathayibacter tritici]PPI20093.1 hypothetical protein C5D07_00495 [Rathayibacter tritici]